MITHPSTKTILAQTTEKMDSATKRARGLLKFKTAPKNFGAIFKLPWGGVLPLVHTIGMQFAIDILFCDSKKRVVSKFLNVGPGRFILPWKYFLGGAPFLLEFSGCSIEKISLGDQLQWDEDV